MALKTHNGNLVLVTWLGRAFAEGRAEQGFVKTAYNSEKTTWTRNAEGGGTRSMSNDKSAKITMKFVASSDSHKLMMTLDALGSDADVGAFEMRDLNGSLLEHAANAYISKRPDTEYSVAVGEREWELTTDELVREVEGA